MIAGVRYKNKGIRRKSVGESIAVGKARDWDEMEQETLRNIVITRYGLYKKKQEKDVSL